MPDDMRPVGFRLPEALIEQIDAFMLELRRTSPGITISRSDAIRVLLERGLKATQSERKGKRT